MTTGFGCEGQSREPSGMAQGADGRTGGRADGRTGGRADGRTGGRADGRTGGRADGRTGGRAVRRSVGGSLVRKRGSDAAVKTVDELAGMVAECFQAVPFGVVAQGAVAAEEQQVAELGERSERDAQEAREFSATVSGRSFSDVRSYGDGCPSQLGRHAESLTSRPPISGRVYLQRQLMRHPPSLEPLVRAHGID
jgi:hypothetical protein